MLVVLALCWVQPAVAAGAPVNDDFENAADLGSALPASVAGDNTGATAQSGEPGHGYGYPTYPAPQKSVWYRWTSPLNGPIKINLCQNDLPGGRIAVYTGSSLSSLTHVAAVHNITFFGCTLTFTAVAGTNYAIAIDSYEDEGSFTMTLHSPSPPSNDNFAQPTVLPGALPSTTVASNVDATSEPGEYGHGQSTSGKSVWFRWQATASGPVKVDLCDSEIETGFSVNRGDSLNALTLVTWSRRGCSATFSAEAGETYRIGVDSMGGNEGGVTVNLRAASPPANDSFASAQELGPELPVSISGDNLDASAEPWEHWSSDAEKTVWYRWVAPRSSYPTVDVCDADFDAIVAVVRGDAVDSALRWAGEGDCEVTFPADAGLTYRIVVDTGDGGEGNFDLTMSAPEPPANDDFDDAESIGSSYPASGEGSNVFATGQTGEPIAAGGPSSSSVWFDWVAPSSGSATFDTCDTDFDSVLDVFTGSSLASLNAIAGNDDGELCELIGNEVGSSVTMSVVGGAHYWVRVTGYPYSLYEWGTFELHVDSDSPPTPEIFGSTPSSGADATPLIWGDAEGGSTVQLFATSNCTGPVVASAHASQFSYPAGIQVDVVGGSTTLFTAKVVDAGGQTSTCSLPYTYVYDPQSGPPAAPRILSSVPTSPGNSLTPRLRGTADPGTTISLYANPGCQGQSWSGPVSTFTGPGIRVLAGSERATTFSAIANRGGSRSECSPPFTYVHKSAVLEPKKKKKCKKGRRLKKGKCVKRKRS